MKSSLVFILFVSLFLSGCWKVGPDFIPPCYPPDQDWIYSDLKEIEPEQVPEFWWQVFQDSTLDELINYAYLQNYSLEAAAARVVEARALLGIAVGEFFPQQQQGFGSATLTKLSRNQPNTSAFADQIFKDYQLGVQASWELDFWGRFRRGIEAAEANLYASIANYDDVMVLLLSDVSSLFVQYRVFQERIDILLRNLKAQYRSYEIADARFRGGFVTDLDVQQSLSLYESNYARLPELEASLEKVEHALCVLLGFSPGELRCFLDQNSMIPDAPEEILVSIPACLLQRRPDIRELMYRTATQSALVGVATSDLFPRISLTGFIGLHSSGRSTNTISGTSGNLLSRNSLTYQYGSEFAWPLLNYGRIINAINVEDARLHESVANYKNRVLRAYQEVEDGMVDFLSSKKRLKALNQSVAAAQRALDLSNKQYVEGTVDYTRVLNSLQALLSEEESRALARGDIALGVVSTYKALGGGWEIRLNH